MGTKGDKLTSESSLTAALLVEKLCSIDEITAKKMFGLVDSKGQGFFKADESNRSNFEKSGSQPHVKMPYMSIPPEILNHQETLVLWAKSSIAIIKK